VSRDGSGDAATVLIVDDDAAFRELVVDILAGESYRLLTAASAEEALQLAARDPVDVVLTDQRMPGADGLELTRRLRAGSEPPEVLLMTAYGTIPQAVEAVRVGAADYLTKPLESPAALRRAVRQLVARRGSVGVRAERRDEPRELLTRDPKVLELLALSDRAAATDATVLITGDSGTGKELLARRIHERSRRVSAPFVVVNCAALPESLAESELFGHEKGAFTGATGRHAGRFETAQGGTLFLDEVGELTEALQAKLLRAIEERVIERVGGTRPVPVDLRLVAATHRDLEHEVRRGRFRSDLFFRLNVVTLRLPPLAERPGDLDLLVPHFVERGAERLGVPPRPVSAEAMEALRRHRWPGNVRELKNVVERALIAATGDEIAPEDLPSLTGAPEVVEAPTGVPTRAPTRSPAGEVPPEVRTAGPPEGPGDAELSLQGRERQAILEALERTGGHRERAARLLGISVRTLYNRLKEYGIG
jgi:two-component system response regulator AtoC